MASEQPFKKRRRYEQLLAEGVVVAPQQEVVASAPSAPQAEAVAVKVEQAQASDESLRGEDGDAKVERPREVKREKEEVAEERKSVGVGPPVVEAVKEEKIAEAATEEVDRSKEGVQVDKEDEKVRKKRNRDKIGNFYKAYRRVRLCLTRRDDPAAFGVKHDLEAAYHSMIELSQGCVSVRRIAAELVPRYAIFCPTGLEAAAKMMLQLSDWSYNILQRGGKEGEGLAWETAEACFDGLVNIVTAAVNSAFELSSLSAMCSEVCRNIYLYLLRQLDGRDLLNVYGSSGTDEDNIDKQRENPDAEDVDAIVDSINPEKLGGLITSSIVQIFTRDPQGVFTVCLELLRATDADHRKAGQHFLAQVVKSISGSKSDDGSPVKNVESTIEVDGSKQLEVEQTAMKIDASSSGRDREEPAAGKSSLIATVIRQLRPWKKSSILEAGW